MKTITQDARAGSGSGLAGRNGHRRMWQAGGGRNESGEADRMVGGEWEAPGTAEVAGASHRAYQKAHPGVAIEAKLQSQDTMIPEFKAAAAAKDPKVGPDIQYFWDGIYTLEDAWPATWLRSTT